MRYQYLQSNCQFRESRRKESLIYRGLYMNYYSYFQHLYSDLGNIWYNRPANIAVVHLWVSLKSG